MFSGIARGGGMKEAMPQCTKWHLARNIARKNCYLFVFLYKIIYTHKNSLIINILFIAPHYGGAGVGPGFLDFFPAFSPTQNQFPKRIFQERQEKRQRQLRRKVTLTGIPSSVQLH
ncbi:MAG: hypothetical protein ISR48_08115 [Alphaproteobacteria bacterium]|nr:hypothetical protein [Alphaproteobacteria bacterium]